MGNMGGPHTQDDQTCMFGDRLPAFEERLISSSFLLLLTVAGAVLLVISLSTIYYPWNGVSCHCELSGHELKLVIIGNCQKKTCKNLLSDDVYKICDVYNIHFHRNTQQILQHGQRCVTIAAPTI